jgi:hypothetical protein
MLMGSEGVSTCTIMIDLDLLQKHRGVPSWRCRQRYSATLSQPSSPLREGVNKSIYIHTHIHRIRHQLRYMRRTTSFLHILGPAVGLRQILRLEFYRGAIYWMFLMGLLPAKTSGRRIGRSWGRRRHGEGVHFDVFRMRRLGGLRRQVRFSAEIISNVSNPLQVYVEIRRHTRIHSERERENPPDS